MKKKMKKEDSIGKDTSFNEIISIIFKNEYIKIIDDSFRNDLLKKILTKDDFIYNNRQIFSLIINIDTNPEEMKMIFTRLRNF